MARKKAVAADSEPINEPAPRIHIVQKGDTMISIARYYLGDPRRVDEIRKTNRLSNDVLKVGSELTIPDM